MRGSAIRYLNKRMRVLFVEDSKPLQKSVAFALRRAGYSVDVCGDGDEGLFRAETVPYDVLVLDLMLPKVDGLTILKRLRDGGSAMQILILTARDTVPDRVRGLQGGADDYLVKPFALDELLARVGALCRRAYARKNPRHEIGDLVLDIAQRTVARGGTALDLTPREYRILEYLALRSGEVVSRTDIWNHVYDESGEPFSNAVDSAVCTLRKKLDAPGGPPLLHTRRGMGYVLSYHE